MGILSDMLSSGTSGYGHYGCHCKDDDDDLLEELALLAAGAAAAVAIAQAVANGRRRKRSADGQGQELVAADSADVNMLEGMISQGRSDRTTTSVHTKCMHRYYGIQVVRTGTTTVRQ